MTTVKDPVTAVRPTFQQSPVTKRPRIGVVLHHAATTNIDQVISMETTGSRVVSSNRVVKDKQCVKIANDPEYRAWSLSDAYWDSVLSSVECANESTSGWTISAASHETLAQQVAWWAQRDGFRPHREGNPRTWTVLGHREIYSIYGDSYATACPGGMNLDWIAVRAREILAGSNSKPQPPAHKYWRAKMYGLVKGNGKDQTVYAVRLADNAWKALTTLAQLAAFQSAGYVLGPAVSEADIAALKKGPQWT
jgi:hypothetical protein